MSETKEIKKTKYLNPYIGGVLLGLHVTHGFWSAFQTIGFSNKVWLNRLQTVAKVYAVVVALGFAIIPLYFMIKF